MRDRNEIEMRDRNEKNKIRIIKIKLTFKFKEMVIKQKKNEGEEIKESFKRRRLKER